MLDPSSDRHGIGGNNPPDEATALRERLQAEQAALLKRAQDLEATGAKLPDVIQDETTAGRVGDYMKAIQVAIKDLDSARAAAKAPFTRLADVAHNFFLAPIDRLKKLKDKAAARQKAYLDKKAAEERAERQRQQEEARQRAERERLAALEAQRQAEEKARVAREAEEAARRQAEEERRRREAAEAEAQRLRDEAAKAAIAPAPAPAPPPVAPAEPLPDPVAAQREAALAKGAAIRARSRAALADADAHDAEKRAAVRTADLARTRSDYGSVSTLQDIWTFRDLNRAKLDLLKLRQHLPLEALEQAVRSFIKAGGRELKGVVIYQTTTNQVR